MALPTASDNAFPSVLITEGTVPASPAAGKQRLYVNSTSHLPKLVNSSGAEIAIGPEFATQNAKVATSENTTSTTFADLTTPGPSVTVVVGASGKVEVACGSQFSNGTPDKYTAIGFVVSGANTVAAQAVAFADSNVVGGQMRVYGATILTGLSTGSSTFKMQYLVEAGTGTFVNREITVKPVF